MSELPPYLRDADQSPPPSSDAVVGQAGRPAVSPVQESALPLSGGGAPPPVVNFPPPVTEERAATSAGGDLAVPTAPASAPTLPPSGIPIGPITQADYDRIAPRPAALDATQLGQHPTTPLPPEPQPTGTLTPPKEALPAPTTPGPTPGTTAVQSPEPAKTAAAPVKPGPGDQPLATTPGAAALPQPEVAAAPYKGTIPMAGFNWLANRQPEVFNTIATVGQKFGVSTERLIQHARMESDLNLNVKDGEAGEQGPFQIEPKTQKYLQDKYLGGRQLDPKTWEGGATLAALKVRECDRRGADSYASVACYNGGGDAAKEYAAKFFSDKKSSDYSKLNFGDLEKPDGGSTMTANGYIKAVKAGGPDGGMRYMVDTAGRGLSMTDGWQNVQSLLLEHFILKGDMDGAEKAQNFVMQQAFMGSNMHLMGAMASLERGDGMTAAQQLAKAHAFFPDGTAGRFMTNGKEVFGVRLDETTGKPLGSPFKITAQDLNSQLKFTGNPATFTKFLSDQQKAAADIRLHNAQAGVQETKPALELLKEQGRGTRAAETRAAAENLTHLRNMYADRRQLEALNAAAASKAGEKDAETSAQLDKFMADNTADWPVLEGVKPEQQAAFIAKRNQLARGLKANSPKMNMDPQVMRTTADKIMKGEYTLIPSVDQNNIGNNGFFVADGKTLQRVPGDLVLDTPTGELLTGKTHPARRPPPQQQGGTANSVSDSGAIPGATTGGAVTGASLARYAVDNARPGGPSSVEGVSAPLAQKIHAMVAAMPPEVAQRFKIISGYRDRQRQIDVYRDISQREGREVRPPLNSRHGAGTGPAGTGSAVDLRDDPVVLDWINRYGPSRFGLGFPLRHLPKEQNHMEMVDPQGRRIA